MDDKDTQAIRNRLRDINTKAYYLLVALSFVYSKNPTLSLKLGFTLTAFVAVAPVQDWVQSARKLEVIRGLKVAFLLAALGCTLWWVWCSATVAVAAVQKPAPMEQKPAPPPSNSQAQLEQRVRDLETRLGAAEQKAETPALQTKDLIYGVGIGLTFVLGAWNLLMAYNNTRKTNFINTVTSQRVKWIEQLRQDISTFCGLTYTWCFSQMEGKPQEIDLLRELDRLRHVIRLRLNPSGTHDRRIQSLIAEIPELTHPIKLEELKTALNSLTETTQLLLKEEWEKVKQEAARGDLTPERT